MTTAAEAVEVAAREALADHLGDYTPIEFLPRKSPDEPLEVRMLLDGSTHMLEVRALPTGG